MNSDQGAVLYVTGDPMMFDALKRGRRSLFWSGLAMIVVGILALIFPSIATLALNLIVGWLFIITGAIMFFGAFSYHGAGPFFGALLTSLLTLAAGAFFVFNPAAGAITLTILVAFIFLFNSAFELYLAFSLRPLPGWGWMLGSGLVSAAVGLIIAAGLPVTSMFVLGILIGLSFISTGIATIAVARVIKKAAEF